ALDLARERGVGDRDRRRVLDADRQWTFAAAADGLASRLELVHRHAIGRATRRTPDELRVAHSSIMPRAPSVGAGSLARERVRTQLELHDLARRPLAAFHVEGCARTDGRPQASAFPAGGWVVDAPVHPLRVEAEWVRHAQI